MKRGQPRTHRGAVVAAGVVIGLPLVLGFLRRAVEGDLSLGYVALMMIIGGFVISLLALAFSGGVEPREDREEP